MITLNEYGFMYFWITVLIDCEVCNHLVDKIKFRIAFSILFFLVLLFLFFYLPHFYSSHLLSSTFFIICRWWNWFLSKKIVNIVLAQVSNLKNSPLSAYIWVSRNGSMIETLFWLLMNVQLNLGQFFEILRPH